MASRQRSLWGLLGLVLSLALVLTACGGGTPAASGKPGALTSLEIAVIGQGNMYLSVFAAQEKGYFKAENLDVKLNHVGANDSITALASGSIPITLPQTDGAAIAMIKGAPIKMVGELLIKPPYDLVAQSKYKTLADLKGTKIGVPGLNNSVTIMMQRMLAAKGLKVGDYDMIATGSNPERYAALKSGAVSAVPLVDPANFQAIDEGNVLLGSVSDAFPVASFNSWWANTNWAKSNKDTLVKFLKAMIKAQEWVDDPKNKAEAVKMLMARQNITEKYASLGYDVAVVKPRIYVKNAEPNKQAVEVLFEIHKEMGTWKDVKQPTYEEVLDRSYLDEAQKQAGVKK